MYTFCRHRDRLFVPTLRLEEDEAMSRIQTLLSSMTLS
jgi:hypothetical protein